MMIPRYLKLKPCLKIGIAVSFALVLIAILATKKDVISPSRELNTRPISPPNASVPTTSGQCAAHEFQPSEASPSGAIANKPDSNPLPSRTQRVNPCRACGSEKHSNLRDSSASLASNPDKPRKAFGKSAPFTLDELPEGELKTKLQSLSPEARTRAMKELHSYTFAANDIQSLRVLNNGAIYYSCPAPPPKPDSLAVDSTSPTAESVTSADSSFAPAASAFAPAASSFAPAASAFTPTGDVPSSAPPIFNSKPDAPFHIYIDVNGATVTKTEWNANRDEIWTVAPWDRLSRQRENDPAHTVNYNPSVFTVEEQTWIFKIWERIAEDYAPFNVNVTTDIQYDPDNNINADYPNGVRPNIGWILVSEGRDINGVALPNWNGGSWNNIAMLGAFGRTDRYPAGAPEYGRPYIALPCWVVPSWKPELMAEAASHEMGHALSLTHDGGTTGEYYTGHYDPNATTSTDGRTDSLADPISWGPIMGTTYHRNISQWSKGEYYGYSNPSVNTGYWLAKDHDDLLVISNLIPYRADDHGDTVVNATVLPIAGDGSVSQTGIIETTGNPDVFSFVTGAGTITMNADPFRSEYFVAGQDSRANNLDVALDLYNDVSPTPIATSNPANTTSASISISVPAGKYYLRVRPVAVGNPMVSTPSGYTIYGSLGKYTVAGTTILPAVLLVESGGSTDVAERNTTSDTYSLALSRQPTANVTITVSPDAQVLVDKTSLVFTTANWNTPQNVTVTAVDDGLDEQSHIGTVTHSVSSSDLAFNDVEVSSVYARITDDDSITVTSPNGGQGWDPNSRETWQTNTTKTLEWTSLRGGDVKIELLKDGYRFRTIVESTPNNGTYAWAIPRHFLASDDYSIRVTSVQAPLVSDTSDLPFTLVEGPIYFTDVETNPGFTMTGGWQRGVPASGNTSRSGPGSAYSGTNIFDTNLSGHDLSSSSVLTTLAIDCSGYSNVSLEYASWILLLAGETWSLDVSSNGTAWSNLAGGAGEIWDGWNNGWQLKTYNISAYADGKSTVYVRWTKTFTPGTYSQGGYGSGLSVDDVKLRGNYHPVGLTIAESGNSTDVIEGGSGDSYTVVLASQPKSNVAVNVFGDSQITVSPSVLTFTTSNWNTPQVVTVNAVDDTAYERTHTGLVTHTVSSSDLEWNAMMREFQVAITDNDNTAPTANAGIDQTIIMSNASAPWTAGITYAPITGDADSGISSTKVYTHALDFGSDTTRALINGVQFQAGGTTFGSISGTSATIGTGSTTIGSINAGNANAAPYLNGSSACDMESLVKDMNWQVANGVITLTGLTPGEHYQFRLYNRAYNSSAGTARGQNIGFETNGVGTDITGSEYTAAFNEDDARNPGPSFATFSQVYALTLDYVLAPGVTSLKVYINRTSTGTYHLYGLTNEKVPGSSASANLDGTVGDANGDALTTIWTKVSGPGTVTFANANAVDTVATFNGVGTYTLRLTANDGTTQTADDVVITVRNPTAYESWSDGGDFYTDTNNDGVTNGVAWLLGAANESAVATALLPTFDNTTDPDYFIFTYRRSDLANTDPSATITVQYSSDLSAWTDAVDDGGNVIITSTDDFYGTGVDQVEVKINKGLALNGKLFSRLKLLIAP